VGLLSLPLRGRVREGAVILNRGNIVSLLVTAVVGAIFLLLAFETWALFTDNKTITDYFHEAAHDIPGLAFVIAILVGIVLGHFLWGPASGLLAPAPRTIRELMSRRAAH
jgi:multisubunit Na+/H+ antiporter MnhB subunit